MARRIESNHVTRKCAICGMLTTGNAARASHKRRCMRENASEWEKARASAMATMAAIGHVPRVTTKGDE